MADAAPPHRRPRKGFAPVALARRRDGRKGEHSLERGGLVLMAAAPPPQRRPRKGFARVALARRRDVGMGEHSLERDRPARADVARDRYRRFDLSLRKGWRAAVMARVDNLDPH